MQKNHDKRILNFVKNFFDEIYCKKGYIRIRTHGFSMSPTIIDGDVIIVKKFSNYKKGDIVLYFHNHHLHCHTISDIKRRDKRVILEVTGKNWCEKHTITAKNIIGRVVKILRGGVEIKV